MVKQQVINISNANRDEAFELLKVWYYMKRNNIIWPSALLALEDKIDQLLEGEKDEWRDNTEHPTPIKPIGS